LHPAKLKTLMGKVEPLYGSTYGGHPFVDKPSVDRVPLIFVKQRLVEAVKENKPRGCLDVFFK
jgi:hypothetical protein